MKDLMPPATLVELHRSLRLEVEVLQNAPVWLKGHHAEEVIKRVDALLAELIYRVESLEVCQSTKISEPAPVLPVANLPQSVKIDPPSST